MTWERGIITGRTSDRRTLFVSSSHDTAIFDPHPMQKFALGDFVEFVGSSLQLSTGCQRKVVDIRKCAPFAEIEFLANTCLLILDIIDFEEPSTEMPYRVLRTPFLEKVIDNNGDQTFFVQEKELLKMKVVCKRIKNVTNVPGVRNGDDFWGVLHLQNLDRNGNRNLSRKTGNERTRLEGLICTNGNHSKGKDELYIWVPFGNMRDVFFPLDMRKHRDRWEFVGRWLSFTIGREARIDEDSDYRFIGDVLPTREFEGRCEARVMCSYDPCQPDSTRHLLIEGDACGTIVDSCYVLEKYGKDRRRFEAPLWVHNTLYEYDNRIRWVLSSHQPFWEEECEKFGREKSFERSGKNEEGSPASTSSGVVRMAKFDSDSEDNDDGKFLGRWDRHDGENSSSKFGFGKGRSWSDHKNEVAEKRRDPGRMKKCSEYVLKHKSKIPDEIMNKYREVMENFEEFDSGRSSRLSRKRGDFDADSDFSKSSLGRRDEEVEEELRKYKKIVSLLREMVSNIEVVKAMRAHNLEATREILSILY